MKHQSFIKDYLHFSKKERIGLIILLIIVVSFAVLPFMDFSPGHSAKNQPTDSLYVQAVRELNASQPASRQFENEENISYYQNDRSVSSFSSTPKARLFNFNPNTIDEIGWKELGLRDRTIRTIMNYRGKGGQFRKPDDLQKIYGLRREEFERLRPYIFIPAQNKPNYNKEHYNNPYPTERKFESKASRQHPIDINTADTTEFKSLYGIGSKLAARIVNFREKLGGFYSIAQVGETYGVPDSTFQKIKPYLQLNGATIKKLNINTASYEALNAHPYISSKLAYLITKQRKTAPLTSMESLKELVEQTNDSYEKVEQYVLLN